MARKVKAQDAPDPPSKIASLRLRLFDPVDASSLILFRVFYGLIMAWHSLDYLTHNRIARWYVDPPILFHYAGFSWLAPGSKGQLEALFIGLAVLALAMAAGVFYRAAASLFFVGYLYVFLLDAARYNNHEYLICLLNFLMIFLPAGALSVVGKKNVGGQARTVPLWSVWLLRFQVGVPYFFGGIAKLNYDWLVRGEPIGLWLREGKAEGSLSFAFFQESWSGHAFAWSGTLFDLLIVPALLWRRTRVAAFTVATAFHLTNSQLFVIGIFPFMMIALSTIYFEPEWPRRFSRQRQRGSDTKAARGKSLPGRATVIGALACWLAIQLFLPFRYLLIPGHVDWTEEGHRYAWRMKLRHKEGQIRFKVMDRASGRITIYENFEGVLSGIQERMLLHDPELIRQFAHRLADQLGDQGMKDVEIRVDTSISLNHRRPASMLDPSVDLSREPASFWGGASWILPLDLAASLPP